MAVQIALIHGHQLMETEIGVTFANPQRRVRNLPDLEGFPQKIRGNCNLHGLQLKSLKGGPLIVGRSFNCSNNNLTSVEHAPKKIGMSFSCANNPLTDLKDVHLHVQEITGDGYFNANGCPISSHILGLFLIKGLRKVWLNNAKVERIVNTWLKVEDGMFQCQIELINEELFDFAQI